MKKNKITNNSNHILLKKIIKWFLIPIFLLTLWLILSLTIGSYKSLTVLSYEHPIQFISDSSDLKITKDKKIKGVFKANENYLGIIEVVVGRVRKNKTEKEDVITFKVKEFNQKQWQYVNNYKIGNFTSNKNFPFGFTEIVNSKDKSYEFEISSLRGDEDNSIEINKNYIKYYSKYKFPIDYVLRNPDFTIFFVSQKLITFFNNFYLLINSVEYLFPFIFYLLFISIKSKVWNKKIFKINLKQLFGLFVLVLIIVNSISYTIQTSGYTLGLLGLWIFAIYMNKLKSTYTFILAFFLIILSIFGIYLKSELLINEISSFSYFLVVIGLAQSIIEIKHKY